MIQHTFMKFKTVLSVMMQCRIWRGGSCLTQHMVGVSRVESDVDGRNVVVRFVVPDNVVIVSRQVVPDDVFITLVSSFWSLI